MLIVIHEDLPMFYLPGEIVPSSGQYAVFFGVNRKPTGNEITCIRGNKFPPGIFSGYAYKLVDRTKHKG